MSISIVTWTLGLTAAQDVINKAQALGLDGIQYAGDHRDVDPIQLRNSAIQSGLEVIAVDPFNAGPTDPNTASAAGAVAYYKRVIDFAEILGTVPVTLQGLSLWTKNCDNRNDAKDQLLTCCEAVNRYAHERGVRTLYEVCNHYEVPLIHTSQECRELIEAVGEGTWA